MDRGAWWATVHGVAESDTSDLACKWTKTMFNLKSTHTFKTNFQFTRNTHRVCVCVCVCSVGSDSVTLWTIVCQAALFMGFPRQEHWSELTFPSPGDLPDPGISRVSWIGRQILYHCATYIYTLKNKYMIHEETIKKPIIWDILPLDSLKH